MAESDSTNRLQAGEVSEDEERAYDEDDQEGEKINDSLQVSLDLNLCFKPTSDDGQSDSNTDKTMTAEEVSPPSNSRVFSCNYCRRKFFSSQALGGHQNAHKRERTIAKRAMRIGALADHRHVSLASLPLHGLASNTSASFPTCTRPSINIQAHHGSMIMMMQPHIQQSSIADYSSGGVRNAVHQQQPQQLGRIMGGGGGGGGPAPKFEGQNGYFIGGVPVYNAVPFWPGSFRQVEDDEAQSSSAITSNNIDNDFNNFNHHHHHQIDYSDNNCPDLTLKL